MVQHCRNRIRPYTTTLFARRCCFLNQKGITELCLFHSKSVRQFLIRAGVVASLVSCFAADTVQAQNSYGKPTLAMHAQGGKTGSHKLPCSYFETLPADIYKFIGMVTSSRQRTGEDFGLSIPADIKQWQGADFVKISTNQKSLGIAMDFADIADAAYELTPDRKAYTENARCVQKVMYQLKPDCCPTLDDFYTMIARDCRRSSINRQIQEHRRDRLH